VSESQARTASAIFDPTRLRIARQAKMLRKKDLADSVGVSAAAVSQYENGSASPSPKVVAALALALGVPSAYFAADRPLGEAPATTAHFRSLRSTTKQERDRAFAHALMTWELTALIERYVQLPEPSLPMALGLGPDDPMELVEAAARQLRAAFDIPAGPVPHVVRLLESRGVVCTRLPAQTRRVFAFSCEFPRRSVVVLSTERTHRAAGRFDAAHELGHLVLHHDAEPGTHAVERHANVFASEFLAPTAELADLLPARADWKRLLGLKEIWGISIQALLFRARQLRIMPEHTYRRAMTDLSSRGWRTQEPGDDGRAEEPVLLRRAIDLMADEGISIERVANEARLSVGSVEAIAPPDERPVVRLDAASDALGQPGSSR
jgi:Zn-dependent peptidase ImmA (M78 family)/transcriptional regulator with XRE-family HTH domain